MESHSTRNPMRLENRVAIVTGAASGIGQASAQLFAAEGARVLAVDLPNKGLAKAHEDHAAIVCFEKSVSDEDAADAIVNEAIARFGQIDIVMNNAGDGLVHDCVGGILVGDAFLEAD